MKKNDKEKKPNPSNIDFSTCFAAAVCIGLFPEKDRPKKLPGTQYNAAILKQLSVFDHIAGLFVEEKIGEEAARNEKNLWILCHFPLRSKESFAESFIRPLLKKAEKETGAKLICGIGLPSANKVHVEESISSSLDACDLFFFEKGDFFEYQKTRKHFDISFEDYENYSEKAFKSILMKSPDALGDIDSCMELIKRIHYGNKNAVIMRAMNFTGEMAYRLHRYNFLDRDFYHLQDALQEKVLSAVTFEEVKQHIHEYYEPLLSDIYSRSHFSRKTVVEQAKTYIRENYMQPLNVKDLADIACVSPGYFSHMFKDEAGESFKAYLTKTRMNAAMELLLGSDYRLYEISEKVGYNNVRNFEEAFRKQFGSYPGNYKKNTSLKTR